MHVWSHRPSTHERTRQKWVASPADLALLVDNNSAGRRSATGRESDCRYHHPDVNPLSGWSSCTLAATPSTCLRQRLLPGPVVLFTPGRTSPTLFEESCLQRRLPTASNCCMTVGGRGARHLSANIFNLFFPFSKLGKLKGDKHCPWLILRLFQTKLAFAFWPRIVLP